ncbi:MAG: hypothetical protein ACOC2H_07110 [Spirochaetota bacterium]
MLKYKLFEFTPESIERIKRERSIPVNFFTAMEGIDLTTLRKAPRKAYCDLQSDDSKRIIYLINRENSTTLYDEISVSR